MHNIKKRNASNNSSNRKKKKKNVWYLFSFFIRAFEFVTRVILVNIPSYILAKSPELDRLSSIIFAYLLFQLVGFAWAFLINASFALAAEITAFLPSFSLIGKDYINSYSDTILKSSLSYSSTELVAAFYIAYASIRVVIGFAQSVFHIALESIKDFPDVSRILSNGGLSTLKLTPIIFIPSLVLQLSLISADYICYLNLNDGINLLIDNNAFSINNIFDIILGDRDSFILFISQSSLSICRHSGINFLSSNYPMIRRIVFFSLLVTLLQLWQTMLHQFPHWNVAMKTLNGLKRSLFNGSVAALFITSLFSFSILIFKDIKLSITEETLSGLLFGWTLWLFLFTPVLVQTHGAVWAKKTSTKSMMHLAAYIRISHLIILGINFGCVLCISGYLKAQLETTIVTIVIPALYTCMYLFANMCLRAGKTLLLIALPISFAFSLFITIYLTQSGGKGSIVLVFIHIFGKIIHFFGANLDDVGHNIRDDYEDDLADDYSIKGNDIAENLSKENNKVNDVSNIKDIKHDIDYNKNRSRNTSSIFEDDNDDDFNLSFEEDEDHIHKNIKESSEIDCNDTNSNENITIMTDLKQTNNKKRTFKSHLILDDIPSSVLNKFNKSPAISNKSVTPQINLDMKHKSSSPLKKNNSAGNFSSKKITSLTSAKSTNNLESKISNIDKKLFHSNDALQLLADRGQKNSSLVSLGISSKIKNHWVVKMCKRNVFFLGRIARSLTVPSNFVSGISRLFISLLVLLALMLSLISIASVAQHHLQIFPSLIDFYKFDNGTLHFDHKIVNVTLYPYKLSNNSISNKEGSKICNSNVENECVSKNIINDKDNIISKLNYQNLFEPFYAICDLKWHNLSLLDLALISEASYFDNNLQNIIDLTLPDMDFIVNSSELAKTGPMYLEITSKKLNITIVAIRGTDVGRMHDFIENFKLYAEPIIFTLLSGVFPTIRLWSEDTTCRVIEWLYELNSFFGLQSEADYYKPLTHRIFEIAEEMKDSSHDHPILITGHSLGGGLARIVGSLTENPSVTFAPPGLGRSYRKYSATRLDGSIARMNSRGPMHANSVAIITEFDWVPLIDQQVGLTQKILCDNSDSSFSCHMLEGTICHLLNHCGDEKLRFSGCSSNYDITAIVPDIIQFGYQQRWYILPIYIFFFLVLAIAFVPELL